MHNSWGSSTTRELPSLSLKAKKSKRLPESTEGFLTGAMAFGRGKQPVQETLERTPGE